MQRKIVLDLIKKYLQALKYLITERQLSLCLRVSWLWNINVCDSEKSTHVNISHVKGILLTFWEMGRNEGGSKCIDIR